MRVLLMGNPNVGKSAIFSRLTGTDAIVSNYHGSTVEYKKGHMKLKGKKVEIVDVPGTYSLNPTCKAEEVAVDMVNSDADIIINVIDATNLERNLNLTLQLMEQKIPMIIALNLFDEAKHTGITIDIQKLQKLLKIDVIPTVGITGEGIKKLIDNLSNAKKVHSVKQSDEARWTKVGKIIRDVQKIKDRSHTFLEKLSDASISPFSGIPIAIMVLMFSFSLIRFIGENLIGYVFDPIFYSLMPLFQSISVYLGSGGFIHNIIIGNLIDGSIVFAESMGVITTGLYVPFVMILPYIFAFFLILGFLEDSGYLPRLAVLIDNLMHKIGLHGFAIIPMLLGFGCNVPGALATRVLESRREKFIAATLMAICVPCMAQISMVFGLLGKYGIKGLGIVFSTLFIVWIILGLLLNKIMKGMSPEMFIEIPPYRVPYLKALLKKLWMRVKNFLYEGITYVLLGVLIVNILYMSGVIGVLGKIAAPIVVNVLGLPEMAIGALLVGFLRKDVAIGMLLPLGLTLKQLIIASVVLTMYFPCIATFSILIKELGVKDMLKSALIMFASTLLVGFILNMILV